MKKIKLSKQTAENECGLCCISMLATYYKKEEPLSYYRNLFNTGRDGMTLADLFRVIKTIGIEPKAYQTKNLIDLPEQREPFILYMKNNHFVVAIFNKKKKGRKIDVYDPAKGLRLMSLYDLNAEFAGIALTGIPTPEFNKTSKKIREFRHINKIVLSLLPLLLLVTGFSLIAYLVSVFIPLILRTTIDNLFSSRIIHFGEISFTVFALTLFFLIISLIKNKISILLQEKLYTNISYKVIHHLFKINYSFFDNRSPGNIMFRLSLLTNIQDVISESMTKLVVSFTSIFVILSYLVLNYHSILPLLLIIIFIIGLASYKRSQKILIQKEKELGEKDKLDSLLNEIVNNMFQIRCLNLESYFQKNYIAGFFSFINEYKKSQRKIQNSNTVVNALVMFLPIYFVLFLISPFSPYQLSIGTLFALYSISTTLFTQVFSATTDIMSIKVMKASLFYLNDLLDEYGPEKIITQRINEFESLTMQDVSFKYNDTSEPALVAININVNKGEKVSIVGSSGSGKTTLVKLLANLYRPESGKIIFNGIDNNAINSDSFKDIVSVVPQNSVYFNKSIYKNITLDDDTINEVDVLSALETANLLNEVISLPMGIHTIISGQGGNFSGGQLQRLSIARALVRNPQLLILDEATSSLDTENENKIFLNLKKKKISLLTISHRLSTVKDSDKIICLEHGRVIETGNHKELLNKHGYYSNLCKQVEMR
ncbi:ABC-type bacteriocin/lantibiotic exporter with double-glycine peptidase domain [Enterococcus rotai]|uniref:Uncharacterized protein n=1 Tax=Enterococcus rotai TaxID=118060 RepID=A0A0U2VST2_9ENTE|nr:peptidase domain-containing ABC transporter [Enterococcus rotai]ALS36404.1 hypothetical protein ATZ35_04275 [Enterococcus rotai]